MSRSGYTLSPHVAVVDDGPAGGAGAPVFVACLPSGPLFVLEGTAALVWRAVQAGTDVVARVAQQTGTGPAEIRSEVENFLDALAGHGLLQRPRDHGPAAP